MGTPQINEPGLHSLAKQEFATTIRCRFVEQSPPKKWRCRAWESMPNKESHGGPRSLPPANFTSQVRQILQTGEKKTC